MTNLLLLFLAVFTVASAVARSRYGYPDPQKNVTECGRRGKSSKICDPDSLISYNLADNIDKLIYQVQNQTRCPCSSYSCRLHKEGYKIGVALAKKMYMEPNMKYQQNYMSEEESRKTDAERTMHEAQLFAYTLMTSWKLGRCLEDIIIFYSLEDNVLYTMTGELTRKTLTDQLVLEITLNAKQYFGLSLDIGQGLNKMISDYHRVLTRNYRTAREIFVPAALALQSKAVPFRSVSYIPALFIISYHLLRKRFI